MYKWKLNVSRPKQSEDALDYNVDMKLERLRKVVLILLETIKEMDTCYLAKDLSVERYRQLEAALSSLRVEGEE